ncbi:MAG TPA: hypothetical protein VGW40_00095 [Allosphingosinicella sp.]|nr:hypothetical protein [Allosphingosinicella sp.]
MTDQGLYFATLSGMMLLKIVVFVLGYLTIKIGASLLREGVRGEFQFKSEFHGFKGDLASASPGLLFLLVGGVLIGYAIAVDKPISYRSGPAAAEQSAPSVPPPPANLE